MEILGFPEVTLTIAVDKPNALLALRLCDVGPTGSSTFVTWALLNLTHRESHEQPTPLEPGLRYQVKVRLNAVVAHSLAAGHRWRLAVSPTYWPHAWPSPEPVTLSVFAGGDNRLNLPVRPPSSKDADLPPFELAECSAPPAVKVLRPESRERNVRFDIVQGLSELIDRKDGGFKVLLDNSLEYENHLTNIYTIIADDPLSAQVRCERMIRIARGDWQTRVETSSVMSADVKAFHVTNVLDAFEGKTRIFTRTWAFKVARDLV